MNVSFVKKYYYTITFHLLSIDWTGVKTISCNKNQSSQSFISIFITITENEWRVIFFLPYWNLLQKLSEFKQPLTNF